MSCTSIKTPGNVGLVAITGATVFELNNFNVFKTPVASDKISSTRSSNEFISLQSLHAI